MIDFSCIIDEPEDIYHSRSRNGEYLSSHRLADFRKSPFKFNAKQTGQVIEEDKPEFLIGRATHCLILEGLDAFNARFTVSDGPQNPRTGKPFGKDSKAYQDWLSVQTVKDIIGTADFEEMQAMRNSIWNHPEIPALLKGSGQGRPEGTVRANYEGIPCQIKMDWFDPAVGIIDLKTCRDMDFFDSDVRTFGYIFQLAFYRAVLRMATGQNFKCHLIGVDKTDFHISGYGIIPDAELETAERINVAAIRRMKECREKGTWPTGYEKQQVFSLNI